MKKIKILLLWILAQIAKSERLVSVTVIAITEIYSHGSATPKENVLNEKYIEDNGLDSLIPNGYRQQNVLGKQIRYQYSDIFQKSPKEMNRTRISLFSATNKKNQLSLISHNAGLFPPKTGLNITGSNPSAWEPQFKPIDQNTSSLKNYSLPEGYNYLGYFTDFDDDIFQYNLDVSCPKIVLENSEFLDSEIKKVQPALDKFSGYLSSFGYNSSELYNQSKWDLELYSRFYETENSHFQQTGQNLNKISLFVEEKLRAAHSLYKLSEFYPFENMTKLKMSNISRTITKNFYDAVYKPGFKIDLYQGFSSDKETLFAILLGFNKTNIDCLEKLVIENKESPFCMLYPDDSSNIVFELSRDKYNSEIFYARLLYNGIPLDICPYSDFHNYYCYFREFNDLMKRKFIFNSDQNFEDFCGVELEVEVMQDLTSYMVMILELVMIILVFIVGKAYIHSIKLEKKTHYGRTLLVEQLNVNMSVSVDNSLNTNTQGLKV